jgi:HK97 family phage major capsid protein
VDNRLALAELQKATITTATSTDALLDPQQANRLIWKLKEQTALGGQIRTQPVRAPAGEINKAFTAARIIRAATENADDGYRVGATFTSIPYVTRKIRLPWEVTEDVFHENIVGEQLEAQLEDQMTQQWALDVEDLELNGDTADVSPDAAFLTINDGILKMIAAGGSGAHRVNGAAIDAGAFSHDHLFEAYEAMPNRYRRQGGLKLLMSPNRSLSWQRYLVDRPSGGTLADTIMVSGGNVGTPLGRAPIVEVPAMPDNRVLLMDPRNIVRVVSWEVRRRRVTGETDMELAAKDKRFYIFFLKLDVLIEEMDAVVDVYGLVAP